MFVAWTHKKQTSCRRSLSIQSQVLALANAVPPAPTTPTPAVYTQCACLPYLERRHDATCQPCAIGFYKTFEMRHSEPCAQCPADKNVSHVGSRRFCFARFGWSFLFVAACFIRLILLRSAYDCYKPPSGWIQRYMKNAVAIFKEQSQALIKRAADALQTLKKKLFQKWSKATEYLKTKSTDTWKNVEEMFEQLDKESSSSTALNFTHTTSTGKKQTCVVLPLATHVSQHFRRCSFFWFFCRDLPKFERPDDPNVCPYKSVQEYFEHMQEQQDWIDWRNAAVENRAAYARKIVIRVHPHTCAP
jgi:hypothetical protein